jgi:hypothetical protein
MFAGVLLSGLLIGLVPRTSVWLSEGGPLRGEAPRAPPSVPSGVELVLTVVISEGCSFSAQPEVLRSIREVIQYSRDWGVAHETPVVVHAMVVGTDLDRAWRFLRSTRLDPDEVSFGRGWFNDWAAHRIWTMATVEPLTPQVIVSARTWGTGRDGDYLPGAPPFPSELRDVHRFRGAKELLEWVNVEPVFMTLQLEEA